MKLGMERDPAEAVLFILRLLATDAGGRPLRVPSGRRGTTMVVSKQ